MREHHVTLLDGLDDDEHQASSGQQTFECPDGRAATALDPCDGGVTDARRRRQAPLTDAETPTDLSDVVVAGEPIRPHATTMPRCRATPSAVTRRLWTT